MEGVTRAIADFQSKQDLKISLKKSFANRNASISIASVADWWGLGRDKGRNVVKLAREYSELRKEPRPR